MTLDILGGMSYHEMTNSGYLGMTKVSSVVIYYVIIFGRVTLLCDPYNLYKHDTEVRNLNICLHQLISVSICLSEDLQKLRVQEKPRGKR